MRKLTPGYVPDTLGYDTREVDRGTVWDYITERQSQLLYQSYQHLSLVIQCVILATVVAVALAVLVHRNPRIASAASAISAVGLTIPSFALLGLLIPIAGIGTATSVVAVTFYATLPILRNAVVGLAGVDKALIESARGMGMGAIRTLLRIELPLAWPVILAGVRVSAQMSMGIAAIAAYVLGPGPRQLHLHRPHPDRGSQRTQLRPGRHGRGGAPGARAGRAAPARRPADHPEGDPCLT